MADFGEDDQDKLEYLSKGLLQPLVDRSSWRPSASSPLREHKDDDSNQLFMSEPSMSEADSSENLLRLLSPTGSFTEDDNDIINNNNNNNSSNNNMGVGELSPDDEGDDLYLVMPPPPPPTRILNNYNHYINAATHQSAHSPGNTSLSSWESPHISRQVRVHFSPEQQYDQRKQQASADAFGGRNQRQLYKQYNNNQTLNQHHQHHHQQQQQQQQQQHRGAGRGGETSELSRNLRHRDDLLPSTSAAAAVALATTPDRSSRAGSEGPRSAASSVVSEGQKKRLEEFLDDLRITSKGRVQEASGTGANTSFESSHILPLMGNKLKPDLNGVVRGLVASQQGRHSRQEGLDTTLEIMPVTSASENNSHVPATDDTVVMTLSASEDDGTTKETTRSITKDKKTNTDTGSRKALDGDQQNSADDELTAPRTKMRTKQPPQHRRKLSSGEVNGGHRRQRSGDAAAATLLTGRKDWKGMEQDKIPLPPIPTDQDDDDDADDAEKDGKAVPKGHTNKDPLHTKKLALDSGKASSKAHTNQDALHNSKKSGPENGYPSSRRNKPTTNKPATMGVAQFSKFALGSANTGTTIMPSYVNRQTRRLRRDSRNRSKRDLAVQVYLSDSSEAVENTAIASSPTSISESFERPPLSPNARHQSLPTLATSPTRAQKLIQHQQQQHGSGAQQALRNSFSVGSPDWSDKPSHRKTQSHTNGFYNASTTPIWAHNLDIPGTIPGFRRMQRPNPPPSLRGRKSHDFYESAHHEPLWGHSSFSSVESSFSWLSSNNHSQQHFNYGSLERQDTEQSSPYWIPPRKQHHPSDPTMTGVREESKHEKNAAAAEDDDSESASSSRSSSGSSSGESSSADEEEEQSAQQQQSPHKVIRHRNSPFANIGKSSVEKADRRRFLPQTFAHMDSDDEQQCATYICPRCKTRQREFFTVSDAPRQFESASGYVALYFVIYVIAALYIFGLQVRQSFFAETDLMLVSFSTS
jgi:hypothetical protein